MDIQKAIELNKEVIASLRPARKHDHADAVQLGIEALRAALRKEIRIDLPASPIGSRDTKK